MQINSLSILAFSSKTKKLRQINDQHPEQIKVRRLTHRQARKLKPENDAYKTACFEDFEAKLKASGKSLLEMTQEVISKNKLLGEGSQCKVFRIPIKGLEGYALRAYKFCFEKTAKPDILYADELSKSAHPLTSSPNAGVSLAEYPTNIGPFQVIRKLPGKPFSLFTDNVTSGKAKRKFVKAIRTLSSRSQEHFNELTLMVKKLSEGGYRRDNSPGNLMLLPDGSLGLIDTPKEFRNWQEDISLLPRIFDISILFVQKRPGNDFDKLFFKQIEHYKATISDKVKVATSIASQVYN